jgi:Phage tail tube protein
MGKTRAYGADCVLLAAFEGSYGIAPASGFTRLSFKDSTLGAERPLGYDPLLGQGREAQDPFYDAIKDEGDIGVPLDLRGLGFWLKGMFGAPVSTGNQDGTFTHVFTSGGVLPSLTLEIGHAKLAVPRFFRHGGVKCDKFAFTMARTGAANATVSVVAQGETEAAQTIDSAPASFALKRFSQGSGTIRIGGTQLANVVGGKISFANNLERVETIRSDGLIDGVDETEATAEGAVDVRFSTDTTLTAAIAAECPVDLEYGFAIPGTTFALTFHLPRVFLPKKKQEIKGPGGIQASYDWRAARDPGTGYLLRATLTNDVAGY